MAPDAWGQVLAALADSVKWEGKVGKVDGFKFHMFLHLFLLLFDGFNDFFDQLLFLVQH